MSPSYSAQCLPQSRGPVNVGRKNNGWRLDVCCSGMRGMWGGKSVGEEHLGGLRYIRAVCYVIL